MPKRDQRALARSIAIDRVLRFLEGRQHGLLVSEISLVGLLFFRLDVRVDAAAVEDRPHDRTEPELPEIARRKQVAQMVAGEGDAREQVEFGIEVGGGDSDLRRRRGELTLGGADIGTPAQQVGRKTDRERRRRRRQGRGRVELRCQFFRLLAQQDRNRMLGGPGIGFERGNLRFGGRDLRLRRVDVELGDKACFALGRRQREQHVLARDLGLQNLDARLGGAERAVVVGDLGGKRDFTIMHLPHRRVARSLRCLDGAAAATEDVDLP